MPRCHGSFIGHAVVPSASAASGVWTLREAQEYLEQDLWPAQPAVPAAPTATAGNQQVSLSWTAVTAEPPVTDYLIQYSSDAGVTWSTFSDGVSTATSAVVTGLTNGTGYIFRIVAVNALGQGPYGSSSGTVTPTSIASSLLLHFDGTNGSSVFTDSSGNSFAYTRIGDAQISTAQSKFGGASGLFDGNGDCVSFADDAKFQFGTGDFTVEMWLRFSSLPSSDFAGIAQANENISSGSGNGGNAWFFAYNSSGGLGSGNLLVFGQHGAGICSASWSPSVDTWYHVAVTRGSATMKMFVDGASLSVTDGGVGSATLGSNGILIGGMATPKYFDGYIDELRIVKGTAVYTAAFTPPTAAF